MRQNIKLISIFIILIILYLFLARHNYHTPKKPVVILSVTRDKFSIIRDTHEVYAVLPDGSGKTAFPLASKMEEPQWSPDRCWLVFSSRFSETLGLEEF